MLEALQRQLRCCARTLYRQQMQVSDGGNISVRYERDHMLIKGSRSSFGGCGTGDFVVADFDGNLLLGTIEPSKESPLHGAIYRRFKKAGAIVHCHSPFTTACAARMDQLAFSTYHSQVKLKTPVRVFDTGSYAVAPEDVEWILDRYEPDSPILAFLLRSHGLVAVGETLSQAQNIAELLEETAKIHLLSGIIAGEDVSRISTEAEPESEAEMRRL